MERLQYKKLLIIPHLIQIKLIQNIKKKKVEIFGFKLRGFFELQETLGTFFIDKNIFYKL